MVHRQVVVYYVSFFPFPFSPLSPLPHYPLPHSPSTSVEIKNISFDKYKKSIKKIVISVPRKQCSRLGIPQLR
jgi:hypothetical protein